MSDSDDSDFEAMRAKAKNKRLLDRNPNMLGNNDDDSDDELVVMTPSSNKRQKVSVDQRLAQLDHEQKIQQRNRQNRWKQNDDSSSDDDSDEEPVIVVQESLPVRSSPQTLPSGGGSRRSARLRTRQAPMGVASARRPLEPPQPPPKQASTKRAMLEEIYLSSDDEEETPSSHITNNPHLMQARQARANLLAQPRFVDTNDDCVMLDCVEESPRNEILEIIVDPTVDRNGTGSEKCQSITFHLPANEKLAVLEQSLLRELKLPSDSATIICKLRCGPKALHSNRTAAFYALETKSNVHASIFVTTWGSKTASMSAQNYGPSLKLILRKGETKTTVTYGLNQPFKQLLDNHGVLMFDGERLPPNKTPSSYEMENEDLIDIL